MIDHLRAAANRQAIENLNPQEYPNLYKLLYRRRGGLLKELLYIFNRSEETEYLQHEAYGAASFPQSIGHFTFDNEAKAINRSKQTWHYKLILLVTIGLLGRDKPDRITNNAFKNMSIKIKHMMEIETGRKMQAISYWFFDKYTEKQLRYCEKKAKKWLDSKATFSSFTKETIISTYGENRADTVYQDKRKTSALSNMAYLSICDAIAEIIASKGYAYRDEVLTLAGRSLFYKLDAKPDEESLRKALTKAMSKVQKEWSKQRLKVLNAGGNQYGRPRKVDRAKFSITGNAWIISPLTINEHGNKQVTK